jgi:predicted nuclease of predicted toxin-antitoxin system
MRFKTDENIHPDLCVLLRENGHDALTAWDQGLKGRLDSDLAATCRAEECTLVTLDVGFGDIRAYPPGQYPGLIVLRLHDQSRRHVLAVFSRLLPLLAQEPVEECLWVVDEHRVRIRRQ